MSDFADRPLVRLYSVCENGHAWESFIAPQFAAKAVERQGGFCFHGWKRNPEAEFPFADPGDCSEMCGSRNVVTTAGDTVTWGAAFPQQNDSDRSPEPTS